MEFLAHGGWNLDVIGFCFGSIQCCSLLDVARKGGDKLDS